MEGLEEASRPGGSQGEALRRPGDLDALEAWRPGGRRGLDALEAWIHGGHRGLDALEAWRPGGRRGLDA